MNLPTTAETRVWVDVDDSLPGVVQLRATGVVVLPQLRDAFAELARTCAPRPDLRTLVFDAENVERFGRGAVVEASRWITRNAKFFDTAVTATRSPSLKSAVMALAACAPSLSQSVVASRDEALNAARGRALQKMSA